ncbi:MAG TPA: alcohol dehydrogenase catalytic domain-containing protein [Symbiobacteriaceae bacterium]|nr:alcohol dehydrogenase catalytic domain-containing protein [Symbiobacteriaceae bacterium]
MKAIRFDGTLRYISDHEEPIPGPGEARIRVTLAGICATDLAITQGYKGWHGILGHEFVGVVDALGADTDSTWLGRRVVGEINVGCGECERCRSGLQNHCPNRSALGIFGRHGAFATWCTLPVRNLHTVPDHVPDEAAVFTEPLAAALEITEQVHITPNSSALVVGDGRLGCLVAQVLALTGADIAVAGRHPERLQLLTPHGIRRPEQNEQFPLVVECTGSASGLQAGLAALQSRGRLILKTTHEAPPPVDWADLMVRELTVLGSRCGPFAPALRLLAAGKVDVRSLISAEFPLTEGTAAFAAAPGRLKVLIRP